MRNENTINAKLEEWGREIEALFPEFPLLKDVCEGLKKSQYPAALFVGGGTAMTLMTRTWYRFYHRPQNERRLNCSLYIIGHPASNKSMAEDIIEKGWEDVQTYHPTTDDTVIGIAASGTTPYVIGAVREARRNGLLTGCITSNPNTPLAQAAEYSIETIVGPEFVTGSSRMKSGTAQKMVLNMISTSLMIRLGRVKGNRMVKMQLTNAKLVDRGTRMLQDSLGLSYEEAQQRLLDAGSVDKALK